MRTSQQQLLLYFRFPPKLPKLQLLALPVALPKHFQREATKLHQRQMFTRFFFSFFFLLYL